MSTAQPRRPLEELSDTARRAAVWTIVVLGIGVFALAVWRLRLVVALLFLAFVIAAAMRPGVEALARRRVPPGVSVAIHYLAIVGLIALFIWLVVPRALGQVEDALGVSSIPTSAGDLDQAAGNSTGVQHELLVGLQKRLQELPSASSLVRPGVEFGLKAFEVVIGIFFVFASAAYWIFERDRAIGFVCSLVPRPKRKLIRDTWTLIDLKLGAFVRGQLILVAVVATVLSLAFWAIGEPYWILIGAFAGLVDRPERERQDGCNDCDQDQLAAHECSELEVDERPGIADQLAFRSWYQRAHEADRPVSLEDPVGGAREHEEDPDHDLERLQAKLDAWADEARRRRKLLQSLL